MFFSNYMDCLSIINVVSICNQYYLFINLQSFERCPSLVVIKPSYYYENSTVLKQLMGFNNNYKALILSATFLFFGAEWPRSLIIISLEYYNSLLFRFIIRIHELLVNEYRPMRSHCHCGRLEPRFL